MAKARCQSECNKSVLVLGKGSGFAQKAGKGASRRGSGVNTRPNLALPLPRALLLPKSLALLPTHFLRVGDEDCSKRRAILPFVREGCCSWAAGRRRGVLLSRSSKDTRQSLNRPALCKSQPASRKRENRHLGEAAATVTGLSRSVA